MVLRRGDWETGDVICHECHLTAPPLLPSSLLFHISPFFFPTSYLIVCLSLRSPLFIVMIYLNTFYISHLSSSRLSCSLTLHISSPYFRTALPTYIYCTESPNFFYNRPFLHHPRQDEGNDIYLCFVFSSFWLSLIQPSSPF